jgi:choline dehydrogenase
MSSDYLVVGAGPAGCALAGRLAGAGASVTVLEGGGPDTHPDIRRPGGFAALWGTDHDWNYTTAAQSELGGRRLAWPRGRVVGGSASINAQMWVRGTRADYDAWGDRAPGWSWADVAPVFARMEHRDGSNRGGVYGTRGPQWISEVPDPNPSTAAFFAACDQAGIPRLGELNDPERSGYAPTPVTQRAGRRWTAADGYLRPAVRAGGVRLITAARVLRVLFDGDRATGVEYRDPGGVRHRVSARREVVLCAGAIGSPHLLMLSGIGPRDQLDRAGVPVRHALPGVGGNLQDHPAISLHRHCPRPVSLLTARSRRNRLRYALRRRGPLASNVAEAVAFLHSGPGLAGHDLELIWSPAPYSDRGRAVPAGHGLTIDVVLLQPHSRGSIDLVSADPDVPPRIDPAYLSAGADLDRLMIGVRRAERVFGATAMAPYRGAPMDPYPGVTGDDRLERYVREHLETLYHPAGTCRMGSGPDAVVDPRLRVHGVAGLRIADVSVLPTLNRGHTLAPAVLIGERAADFLTSAEVAVDNGNFAEYPLPGRELL